MYLSKVKIWNFRKFETRNGIDDDPAFEIKFNSGLNVLVGENDAGKTAVIDAIKKVLNTHSAEWRDRIKDDDFSGNSEQLKIECYFNDLSDNEAKNFIEWLNIDESDEENNGTKLKVSLTADKNSYPKIRAGFGEEGYVMNEKAQNYLKVVYLKPLRDVESEFIPRKGSRLSKILDGHEVFSDKVSHELKLKFNKFNNEIKEYFLKKSSDGNKIKKHIDTRLNTFIGDGYESLFSVNDGTLMGVLEKLELGFNAIPKPGLGTLNRLFIAAELLHLNKEGWTGLRLGLIEELEAHLHPQAQLKVIESLQDDEKSGTQLILTTHSPNLTSKVKLENLILISKVNNNNRYGAFPLKIENTELEAKDVKKLERFLDVTKSNLFFSRGVILVEGWAEELLIPEISKKIGFNLVERGVSIINVQGINFKEYAKVFQSKDTNHADIPISILTDNDIAPDFSETEARDKTKENNKFKEELNKQSVKVFRGDNWTLEWVLFNSDTFSKDFRNVVSNIHSKTDEFKTDNNISDNKKFSKKLTLKLKDKSLKKTEIAYQLSEKIKTDNTYEVKDRDENIKYIIDAIRYACGEEIRNINNEDTK